mmetsp:Transcript_19378/g.27283  ORF Transcript_19378/g.27283 Transcript_19378/m.27283 type:complete len:104 (-) Transcript_19378:146-457(-)
MEHDPVFDETEPTKNLEELRDEGIIILRGFLDDAVQEGFYEGLLAHAEGTVEVSQLAAAGCPFPAAPFPFLLYNNPTTKTGNHRVIHTLTSNTVYTVDWHTVD